MWRPPFVCQLLQWEITAHGCGFLGIITHNTLDFALMQSSAWKQSYSFKLVSTVPCPQNSITTTGLRAFAFYSFYTDSWDWKCRYENLMENAHLQHTKTARYAHFWAKTTRLLFSLELALRCKWALWYFFFIVYFLSFYTTARDVEGTGGFGS